MFASGKKGHLLIGGSLCLSLIGFLLRLFRRICLPSPKFASFVVDVIRSLVLICNKCNYLLPLSLNYTLGKSTPHINPDICLPGMNLPLHVEGSLSRKTSSTMLLSFHLMTYAMEAVICITVPCNAATNNNFRVFTAQLPARSGSSSCLYMQLLGKERRKLCP